MRLLLIRSHEDGIEAKKLWKTLELKPLMAYLEVLANTKVF